MAVVTMMMGMVRGEREKREEGYGEGVVAREAIYHVCHYPLNAIMYSDLGGNVD